MTPWKKFAGAAREAALAAISTLAVGPMQEPLEAAVAALRELAAKPSPGYPREYALQVLVVEGHTRFPLGMLERDRCFPRTESDAHLMGEHHLEQRRVELARIVRGAEDLPHVERWRSFGWTVVWAGTRDRFEQGATRLK